VLPVGHFKAVKALILSTGLSFYMLMASVALETLKRKHVSVTAKKKLLDDTTAESHGLKSASHNCKRRPGALAYCLALLPAARPSHTPFAAITSTTSHHHRTI
tara:strand:+ start:2499 stop:2807 length:309 start_codon:yes stop_codon:yes gene_type:complete